MPYRQPQFTATSRLLARAADKAATLRQSTSWTIAGGIIGLIFLFDLISGTRLSLLPLYLLVTCFAAWCLGERQALALALVEVAGALAVRHVQIAQGMPIPPLPITTEMWNAVGRLVSLALIAVLVNGFRTALDLEKWQSSIDPLTGALSKRAFLAHMTDKVAEANRQFDKLILAYMDLDGFKEVNDRHGHSCGDLILAEFASGAIGALREGDLFGRVGGDEFVALLTARCGADGNEIAQILHQRLTQVLGEKGLGVTCSMGVLVLEGGALEASDHYVALADALMYEVKAAGKNALRIGRVDEVGVPLRVAFHPAASAEFDDLLAAIDRPVRFVASSKAA